MLSPQPDRVPGVLMQREGLPCPALLTVILEAPSYKGEDWVIPFLQMLRGRAAAGSQLQHVRIVFGRGTLIPGEGERREMEMLVPRVELMNKDEAADEQRVSELFEWQHEEDHCGSSRG